MEESAEKLRKRFAEIRNMAPSILFFDGLDQFLTEAPRPFVTISVRQLLELVLIEIDRLPAPDRVFLVGATEEIANFDPRLLRGGRFSETIEIPRPDLAVRTRLFERLLGPTPLGRGSAADPDQPVPTFFRLTLRDVIEQIKSTRGPLFPAASTGTLPSSPPSDSLPVI